MKGELLTANQIARRERNAEICEKYKQLRAEHPEVPQARIFAKIAEELNHGIMWTQVRMICKRAGIC